MLSSSNECLAYNYTSDESKTSVSILIHISRNTWNDFRTSARCRASALISSFPALSKADSTSAIIGLARDQEWCADLRFLCWRSAGNFRTASRTAWKMINLCIEPVWSALVERQRNLSESYSSNQANFQAWDLVPLLHQLLPVFQSLFRRRFRRHHRRESLSSTRFGTFYSIGVPIPVVIACGEWDRRFALAKTAWSENGLMPPAALPDPSHRLLQLKKSRTRGETRCYSCCSCCSYSGFRSGSVWVKLHFLSVLHTFSVARIGANLILYSFRFLARSRCWRPSYRRSRSALTWRTSGDWRQTWRLRFRSGWF